MSTKLNEIPATKLAGLTADLMNKLRNQTISLEEFEQFLLLPKGIRKELFSSVSKPVFLSVTPLNDIKGNIKNFDRTYDFLKDLTFKIQSDIDSRIIELKKYSGKTKDILKKIDADGFVAAPSPYLLGLGVQYPAAMKQYGNITSLDKQNMFINEDKDSCFLCLCWQGQSELSLALSEGEWDVDDWWFAIIRK